MEDARESPERRVAAALALAPAADSDMQQRLRIATESSAHEPLRVALDSALAGELELEALQDAEATYEASANHV